MRSFNWDMFKTRGAVTADPAAGADPATITVPANKVWKIKTITGTLVADANVATRIVMVTITDGTNTVYEVNLTGTQTASQTVIHNWGELAPATTTGSYRLGTLPNLRLEAGWTISITTTNIQVGDDWTALGYSYQEADA